MNSGTPQSRPDQEGLRKETVLGMTCLVDPLLPADSIGLVKPGSVINISPGNQSISDLIVPVQRPSEKERCMALPNDAAERKTYPLYRGLIKYFPNALAAVAHLSWKGNQQHHPDKPLHWDMSKSTDELDALMRHILDEDWDAVAWRALAHLERELTNAHPED
jgi:hypothetical protein